MYLFKKLRNLAVISMCLFVLQNIEAKDGYQYLYKDLPFSMPKLQKPVFPKNTTNLTEFGGVGDGVTLNTDAFAKAIKNLAQKGGGTLNVPKGIWLTGPIVFSSNINLHLEKGALILFSPDFNLYPIVETIFEGLDTRRCQSPCFSSAAARLLQIR